MATWSYQHNSHSLVLSLLWLCLFFGLAPNWSAQTILPSAGVADPTALSSNPRLLATILQLSTGPTEELNKLLRSLPKTTLIILWSDVQRAALNASAEPEQMLWWLEITRIIALRVENVPLLASTYYHLGAAYSHLEQFPQAVTAYREAERYCWLDNLPAAIYILAELSQAQWQLQQYAEARASAERVLSLLTAGQLTNPSSEHPLAYGAALAWHTLWRLAARDHNQPAIEAAALQAVNLFRLIAAANPYYAASLANILREQAQWARQQGFYGVALAQVNQAIALVDNKPQPLAHLCNDLGLIFLEQEDYETAGPYFQQSLALFRQQKNLTGTATALLNVAVIEQRRANFDASAAGFQQAEATARSASPAPQDIILAAGEGQGTVLTGQGHYAAAQSVLASHLALAQTEHNQLREAEILWRLAQNYYATGDFPNTITLATQARDLAQQIQYAKLLSLANTTLGQGYLGLADKPPAKAAFQAAVTTIEALRHNLSSGPAGAPLFLADRTTPYQALALLALEEHDDWAALNWTERAKARTLFDLVSQAERLARDGTFSGNRPERAQWPALERANLQPLWRQEPRAAYLSYLVTSQESYLFVLTGAASDLPILRVIPLRFPQTELTAQTRQFQEMLATRQPGFRPLAQVLYTKLVLPALSYLPDGATLGFAPDGPLWDLSFQALMSAPNRYLLDDYPLFYTPSLSFLTALNARPPAVQPTPLSLLALGNPVSSPDTRAALRRAFGDLPDAGREVKSLASLLGPGRRSQILAQAQASEAAFKTLAPKFRVLHLATHGIVNRQRPLHSYLTLTASAGPGPAEDGLLEAWEVMNLPLQADLAALSACETGAGKISPGEGVIGLSWAFLVAGSRNVIASRWAVNSSGTARLMTRFYEARQKQSLPAAWRTAALDLKADKHYAHPHYWASFGILGAN